MTTEPGKGGQVIGAGAFAGAVVVVGNYAFHLDAPDYVVAALTTLFTAIFVYLAPFLPRRRAA